MFLCNLNSEQKQAFLGLAHQFISADGQLMAQEQTMLNAMKAEMGLTADVEAPASDLSELLKPFDSKQARATALLALIGLGYSDNDFHSNESEMIARMADTFQVSKEEILQMESWVVRQIMLVREATQFLQ